MPIDYQKYTDASEDFDWVIAQILARHNTKVEFRTNYLSYVVASIYNGAYHVEFSYTNFRNKCHARLHAHSVERIMDRRMTLLLFIERGLKLTHTYQPSKEFEDFWNKTNGRTT